MISFITFKKGGLLGFKIFSGLCLAYVLTLIGQKLISYGSFSFAFMLISITIAFVFALKNQGFLMTFIINFLLILLAVLLRLYIILIYTS